MQNPFQLARPDRCPDTRRLLQAGAAHAPGGGAAESTALAVHHRFKEAFRRRDPAALAALFTPEATYAAPTLPQAVVGRQAIEATLAGTFAVFPDMELFTEDGDAFGQANRLCSVWTARGTWRGAFTRGPLVGMTPTGRAFHMEGVTVFTLEGNHISRYAQFWNLLSVRQQIGAL